MSPAPGRTSGDDGPGQALDLITSGRARTRTALAEALGLSRSTTTQRLEPLLACGLVREEDDLVASGGRPSRSLGLNPRAGLVVSVDIGEERTRVAVTDLETTVLGESVLALRLDDGPEPLLDRISEAARQVLHEDGLDDAPVVGIGLGVPAPVDSAAGKVTGWSIMSGWDGFDVRDHLRRAWGVPVVVDNDVNVQTVAEHHRFWPHVSHLFYVKIGTGVGSGMVVDGAVNRGAQGGAGDIGHAHVGGYGDPQCRCGNLGCLESLVGGWALARDLRDARRPDMHDARDVARQVTLGEVQAVTRLRAAGRILGEAVAFATSLLNPEVIVLGGLLSVSGDHLMAGVRETVYQRSHPLATRHLRIVPTGFRSRSGTVGASYLVRDHVLSPARVDALLAAGGSPFELP
ncbi:ROK family transcriptional regulator [Kineococcus sp. NPDC059986]|uniref:ROK family transcriptional regulator n=1 Tax=Kineococcus sp. NPDC059986 TaxID=3155538 RepID=UPI00344F2FED